jgi:hypothetical protein
MITPRQRPRFGLRARQIRALGLALVLTAAYVAYLGIQNARVEGYFARLRIADPVRYLDDLRKNEGFESYLDKYRLLEGFSEFRPDVPVFLLGRWTLKDRPERLASGAVAADCLDPIAFEQGLAQTGTGDAALKSEAAYRIVGNDVYARIKDEGLVRIHLVIYGNGIDHIELVPPGRSQKFFGYYCGN